MAVAVPVLPTAASSTRLSVTYEIARLSPVPAHAPSNSSFPSSSSSTSYPGRLRAVAKNAPNANAGTINAKSKIAKGGNRFPDVIESEKLPFVPAKSLDLVDFTRSLIQAIPGPRVGRSSLPWILAIPLSYAGITFVMALVRAIQRVSSPKEKRRSLVRRNAMLCKSIDELLNKGRYSLRHSILEGLAKKTGFNMEDILRKYVRYAMNEKPFNAKLVANLIELRKATMLEDSRVAEVLHDISRRIVREKGPVVVDMSGYTEKGFKRKLAVQALFGKVFYLSELPAFCSKETSLSVKQIFGVRDDCADKFRLHTLSEAGDFDSLKKMVDVADGD